MKKPQKKLKRYAKFVPATALLAGIIMLLSQTVAAKSDFGQQWQSIESDYKKQLSSLAVVGSATRFIHRGKIVASSYYGDADREKGYKVDENTVFHWASITKTFTGIAIMQLRDRGLLRLNDPIVAYLPELKVVHSPFGDINNITIRHVMNHASGFRGSSFPWRHKKWHSREPTQWSQLVAMMPYTQVAFKPGSKFSYSNLAIIFLGQIIKQVSGDDIEVYIDKNIFKPLTMYSAYFDHTPYHLLKHRSNNYTSEDGKIVVGKPDFDTGITTANGGLNASINDMSKYVAFLIGDENNSLYQGVLKRSSLQQMWQKVHLTGHKARPDEGIGLTFFTRHIKGERFIGHSGSQKSFTSFISVNPKRKTGAIGVFNTQIDSQDKQGKYIDHTLQLFDRMQQHYYQLMPSYRP